MVKIAPSILSAKFSNLEQHIRQVEKGRADWLHLDVMDGHFVPSISFGPIIVETVRSITKLPLDTHLMIEKPELFLKDFKEAGTDRLTVHVEACTHLHRTIEEISALGLKAGVALNPATPATALREIIPYVDLVLVMTVNPGFGGQQFIRTMVPKVREIAEMIKGSKIELEVDGGVAEVNASKLVGAGATVLVAGHSIFAQKNPALAVQNLRKAAHR